MTKQIHFTAVILVAGEGKRMKSSKPKVLHTIAGLSMIGHSMNIAKQAGVHQVVVVISPRQDAVRDEVMRLDKNAIIVVQEEPLGTGDAVRSVISAGLNIQRMIVIFGDSPLLLPATLHQMLKGSPFLTILGFTSIRPDGYGRIVMKNDKPIQIIEDKDTDDISSLITLCNGGAMAMDVDIVKELIVNLSKDNEQGEYLLSDILKGGVQEGCDTLLYEVDLEVAMGVNTRQDLARAEFLMQGRLRKKHLANGVTLISPEDVFFSYDTQIGRDVIIEPHCFFGKDVIISDDVIIKAFSHLEGVNIGRRTKIGPFARLRPYSNIGEEVRIGNFVETKNVKIEQGTKINHLSYIGDTELGKNVNIGAGTVTCNYDGFNKYTTKIGSEVFIGSNSVLIAPIQINEGAYVGASSAVSSDVQKNDMVLTRAPLQRYKEWATRFRSQKRK